MSIASLIHSHSYNLDAQVADGVFSRQQLERRGPEDTTSSSSGSSSSSSPPAKYVPPTSASFYIPSLPGLSPDSTLTLYGGHLPSTVTSDSRPADVEQQQSAQKDGGGDSHLFFFLARARHIAEREKLVIWLNGGPGCSSFDGALMEIGPLRMAEGKKGEVIEQAGAWNEYANVLFIDQPAGTGYSYVKNQKFVHSGEEAAQHVVTFLKNFYEVFPEYAKMDLYIAGESFAGIWIPYLASALRQTTLISPPLQGLMIGNGWIDPYNQYPAYVDFAYSTKLLDSKSGATSASGIAKVQKVLESCNAERQRVGKDKFPINSRTCEGVLGAITETTLQVVNGKTYCVNNYDIRLTDTHPACGMNWPNLLPDMYAYLPRPDVVNAFHASATTKAWTECNGQVSDSFWASTRPSVHLLPGLLEAGIPIMLFSGMQDLICNHVGTEALIDDLSWNKETGMGNASRLDWYVDGKKAGTWQTARNLTYVQVYNASHMVPFDLPVVAHDMLSRFLSTDYISAAGAAAGVPSRIGSEEASIVGETHLNGTAFDGTAIAASKDDAITGLEKTTSAATTPVADAYYNVGAAMLVLLLIALVGIGFVWRQRRKYRSGLGKHNLLPTSGGLDGNGMESHLYQHKRTRSNASDRSYRAGRNSRRTSRDEEESNELLAMDKRGTNSGSGSLNGNGRTGPLHLPKGEELFSVGEEDEDEADSEEDGNLGKSGRRLSSESEDGHRQRKNGYDV